MNKRMKKGKFAWKKVRSSLLQALLLLITAACLMLLIIELGYYRQQKRQLGSQLAFLSEQGSIVSAMRCQVDDNVYAVDNVVCKEAIYHYNPTTIETDEVKRSRLCHVSDKEKEVLCRIVEAEAGGEDDLGKKMVADVVINRVLDARFPNSIEGVVFQGSGGCYQFSPISDGRYYRVRISGQTRSAVDLALRGEDDTDGALYFVAPKRTTGEKGSWFANHLSFRKAHGGHCFYR